MTAWYSNLTSNSDVIQWYSGTRDDSVQFVYDYTKLMIEPYQIFKTFTTDGYLRASFHPDLKMFSPQLILSDSSAQMNTYYVSALDIVLVPEPKIVIENTPIMNGAPINIHIPLKYKKGVTNSIDQLLKSPSKTVELNINALFNDISGKIPCAYFKGQSILYTQAIIYTSVPLDTIKNAIQPMVNSTILKKSSSYTIVYLNSFYNSSVSDSIKKSSVIEGLDTQTGIVNTEDDVYDCTPLDMGEEAVSEFIQVPFFSSSSGSRISMNMMQGIVYMFYLGIIIVFCVIVVPFIYKPLIDNKNVDIEKDIASLEVFIPFSLIIGSLGLIIEAVVYQQSVGLLNFGLLLTFFVLSVSVTIFFFRIYQTNLQLNVSFNDRLVHFGSILLENIVVWISIFVIFFVFYSILIWGLHYGVFSGMVILYGIFLSLGISLIYYAVYKVLQKVIRP